MKVKWEIFYDESYYGLWAVRPIGDHDFNSPRCFHLANEDLANELKNLLDKTE